MCLRSIKNNVCASMSSHNRHHNVRSLNKLVQNTPIDGNSLRSCIIGTWKDAQHVSIGIENNQMMLFVSSEKTEEDKCLWEQNTFERVTRELNDWNVGTFTLQRIQDLTDNHDVSQTEFARLPLGIYVSQMAEFYGVRR